MKRESRVRGRYLEESRVNMTGREPCQESGKGGQRGEVKGREQPCLPYPEGFWENLMARSTLTLVTSAVCPRV